MIVAGPGTGKTTTLVHKLIYLITECSVAPQRILAVTFTRSAAREIKERIKTQGEAFQWDSAWVETFHALALGILKKENYPFGAETDWTALLNQGQLNFDDLILYANKLFYEKPEIQKQYRDQFSYIIVDEFQDTSAIQYQFLKNLWGENICVIGDPDQAIYQFSSERFDPFVQFRTDWPSAHILSLMDNYRTQKTILAAAQQVIDKNGTSIPRSLVAQNGNGLPIEIFPFHSERQEAEMTVRKIESLLGGASGFSIDSQWAEKDNEKYSYGLSDIAIFYRFHVQARMLEDALKRAGLPYHTFGRKPKKNGEEISNSHEMEDFKNNEEGAPALFGFRPEAISLMTLHRSKGLEFSVVFILGCEEGVIPYYGQEKSNFLLLKEEERRLFYVGMTRAKSRLFLSWAKSRFLFGKTMDQGPSCFLQEFEKDLQEWKERLQQKKKRPLQPTLFDPN